MGFLSQVVTGVRHGQACKKWEAAAAAAATAAVRLETAGWTAHLPGGTTPEKMEKLSMEALSWALAAEGAHTRALQAHSDLMTEARHG